LGFGLKYSGNDVFMSLVACLKVLVVSKLGKHSWMKAVLGSFPFSERYSVNFSAVP
jgi:hypothetical protein